MVAKNAASKTAAQTTQTISIINLNKMVIDNLTVAKDRLAQVTVDLEAMECMEIAADLATYIIVLSDDIENHLVTVVSSKKSSAVDAKMQLGDITMPSLIKMIDEAIKLIESTAQFGNTRLSVRSIKNIRASSDKIKEIAFQIFVQNTLYNVRHS